MQKFQFNLEDNLFELHSRLKSKIYTHGSYQSFYVCDPKLRHIHKASIKDRVVHQAVFRMLYGDFDKRFIFDSYSCRLKKGTHSAVRRLEKFARCASYNYRRPIFALKCDIKKFFDSIDQRILLHLIKRTVRDQKTTWLIGKIISSFATLPGKGLPLGNVTSHLFANIYLNKLDQFLKHVLKQRFYLRYCDDFIILDRDKERLIELVEPISDFLENRLKLSLHPDKIIMRKLRQGVDFLGYVTLPHYRVIRTKTKRRLLRLVNDENIDSYLGICCHASANGIERLIKDKCT